MPASPNNPRNPYDPNYLPGPPRHPQPNPDSDDEWLEDDDDWDDDDWDDDDED